MVRRFSAQVPVRALSRVRKCAKSRYMIIFDYRSCLNKKDIDEFKSNKKRKGINLIYADIKKDKLYNIKLKGTS